MKKHTHRRQRGLSIVEALVALVVIAVGMLGIAGLYLSSLQASRTAKLRTQAVQLVGSLADRIRANRDAAIAYDTAQYGGAPQKHSCDTATCTAANLAEDDLSRWMDDLKDPISGLPGGTRVVGTVVVTDRVRPNPDNYVITVSWREANSDIDYSYSVSIDLANRL
jgi:type IV pilus assembly protein PilV